MALSNVIRQFKDAFRPRHTAATEPGSGGGVPRHDQ